MKYRKEIDGLRAVAVLPVMLFHAGVPGFSGGFVGVDVFFVISGYLITTILLNDLETDRFSIFAFYERRARRILPALFLVLACSLPFAWEFLLSAELRHFFEGLVAIPIFASNLVFWRQAGYFTTSTEFNPLIHTWSLAVEEQFYLFFPWLLFLAWRLGRAWVVRFTVFVFASSLLLAQWSVYTHPNFDFFMLPTRAWELAIGAFIAARGGGLDEDRGEDDQRANWLGLVGLALISVAVFGYSKTTPMPSVLSMLPTLGAALIIYFAHERTWVGRLLGHRFLVGIGLISYSCYLWHQPILAFARELSPRPPGVLVMLSLLAVSIFLAYLSWHYVEQPFRDKRRITREQIFVGGLALSFLFSVSGVFGYLEGGFPSRFPKSVLLKAQTELARRGDGWCMYSVSTNASLPVGPQGLQCHIGDRESKVNALIIGDSFAGQYDPFWARIGALDHVNFNSVSTNWCYPSMRERYDGPRSSPAYRQCQLDRAYFKSNAGRYDFVVLGGAWGTIYRVGQLPDVIGAIRYAASHSPLVVIMPSPKQFDGSPNQKIALFYRLGFKKPISNDWLPHASDADAVRADQILRAEAARFGNVFYIPRRDLFKNAEGQPSDFSSTGRPYSWDGNHISIYGAEQAASNFIGSRDYRELITRISMSAANR